MEGVVSPLRLKQNLQLTGLFLITEDELGIAQELQKAIQKQGATTAVIEREILKNPEKLAVVIDKLRAKASIISGIVHLAGLSRLQLPDNFSEWQELATIQAKSLFHLLQLCGDDLRKNHGQVLGISLLGGSFGRNGVCSPSLPLAGSNAGLLKTMTQEWSEVKAKVIDFSDESLGNMSEIIINEIQSDDDDVEIGYLGGERVAFELVTGELVAGKNQQPVKPGSDWVVLSVGGARGITAEIVSEVLVSGMTLILVGRSPLPERESELTKDIEDVGELRRILINLSQENGQISTPVEIEKQVEKIKRDRAIRANLAKFKQAGVKVEYHAIDVRNVEDFGGIIERIYAQYGRIDAVIQGAGIIQDKLIVNKTAASFDQVFDTKVNSTYILARHLRPESLKLMVIFASVAGRTGNKGQCDYAAANEVLNRFAWWMSHQFENTRVIALNWGPWDITGMASPEVNRQFKERGVTPIPPAAGCQFFKEELLFGKREDVELIVGFFAGVKIGNNFMSDRPKIAQEITREQPLLNNQLSVQENERVSQKEIISLETHPYLIHHCLDGKPVLPAACALELMAELVQKKWSNWQVCEVHDLRVLRGIVITKAAGIKVNIVAKKTQKNIQEFLEVQGRILDENGRAYYRADFILRREYLREQNQSLPLIIGETLDVAKTYRYHSFHGLLFQVIKTIDRFNQQGADLEMVATNPAIWLNKLDKKGWIFDPGLIDGGLQIALMFAHILGNTTSLPSHFGKVVLTRKITPGEKFSVAFRVKMFNQNLIVFDAFFMDKNGAMILKMQEIEMTCSQALNRLVNSY